MRLIVGITLLLLGVGSLSCRVEGTTNSKLRTTVPWVRTVDGWERPNLWYASPARPPQLHPLVVAAGQTLASLLALAAFRRDEPT
jgi:hypothetical protein